MSVFQWMRQAISSSVSVGTIPDSPIDPNRSVDSYGVPIHYSDCATAAEREAWLHSSHGQQLLRSRPLLYEFYLNGRLLRMVHNPHWTARLRQWLSLDRLPPSQEKQFDLRERLEEKLKKHKSEWLHTPRQHALPPAELFRHEINNYKSFEFHTKNKYDILIDGFTIFRGIVPMPVVAAAESFIEEAISAVELSSISGSKTNEIDIVDPHFTSAISNDKAILALFYNSPVYALAQQILHGTAGSGRPHSIVGGAQVAYRYTQSRPAARLWQGRGYELGGKNWHLDGTNEGKYSPFSLLIGIALSDQQQEFSGNLCVFPGSHHTLQPWLKEYATACKELSDQYDHQAQEDPTGALAELTRRKLALQRQQGHMDLGEPTQILVSPGDVVFVLHRVAHRGGPNYSPNVRKMIYFRVSHKDHERMKDAALDDLWIEYEGMKEVL